MFVYSVFILGMVKNMTRYEHIKQGGVEEMAKAMAFMLCRCEMKINDCKTLKSLVKIIMPTFIEWLKEEIGE